MADPVRMALQDAQGVAGREVPQAQGVVVGRRERALAVEGNDVGDQVRMASQYLERGWITTKNARCRLEGGATEKICLQSIDVAVHVGRVADIYARDQSLPNEIRVILEYVRVATENVANLGGNPAARVEGHGAPPLSVSPRS